MKTFRKDFAKGHLKELLQRPFSLLQTHWMAFQIKRAKRPQHVALILDGNRRFARMEGFDNVVEGHARGADRVEDLLNWCEEFDVPIISIWIFSTDNFKRDPDEVSGLFDLIKKRTYELVKKDSDVHKKRVQIRYIGRKHLLPEDLQEAIAEAERATKHYDKFILNVAIAYGGREEITDAVKAHLQKALDAGQELSTVLDNFSEDSIASNLYTADIPDPELIIRTSGEIRLSGFFLWQSVHSEFYFTDVFWPHFNKLEFLKALHSFAFRERRFGK